MSYGFSADEIFEMAVKMEVNGGNFYRNAADGTKDEDGKKLLLNLAAMEDEHEVTFNSMKSELTDAMKSSTGISFSFSRSAQASSSACH